MAPVSTIPVTLPASDDHKASARRVRSAYTVHDTVSLTQLAHTVLGSCVSKRASNDDELWPRKHWDAKVAATIAKHGLKLADCAELRYGNPQDEPIDGIVDVFVKASRPPPGREIDWFAYSVPDPEQVEALAARMSADRGVEYRPEDMTVTDGSLAALDLLVYVCTDPGDEIIILSPVYFNYPVIMRHRQAAPVIVPARQSDFQPDVEAIRNAITPRTKAIIVNSPNNPTGVLYSRESLVNLSHMLTEINANRPAPILVISDEAYSRIVYDNAKFISMTTIYPHSAMTYTTGKTLLAPGQRLGYIALSPLMPTPHRTLLRRSLKVAQNASWAFPASPLLHSINELDTMSIDIPKFQSRRDYLCDALARVGYKVYRPTGTFYVCILVPRPCLVGQGEEERDEAWCLDLAARGVLVMPGQLFGWNSVFRISLTANERQLRHAVTVLGEMKRECGQDAV